MNRNDEGTSSTKGVEARASQSFSLAQQQLEEEASAGKQNQQQAVVVQGRKNFTASDDLVLLRAVNMVKHWEATKGTANGIMKSFDKIAEICGEIDGFIPDKQGAALRTCFDKLARQHRDAKVVSRRASGTTEEYSERDMLLQDILTRMDDWNEQRQNERRLQQAKDNGIEASGAVMRNLAMRDLDDELQGTSWSADETATSEHDRGSTSARTNSGSAPYSKRANTNSGGRVSKVGKMEKVAAVTDGIALAISEMNKGNPEKYVYLNHRMQFEREEAEKKREHEIKMELQRQEGERDREERLSTADREREKIMLKLLEMAMSHNSKEDKE